MAEKNEINPHIDIGNYGKRYEQPVEVSGNSILIGILELYYVEY